MQTLFGRTSIINFTNPPQTNTNKFRLKIRFGKIIAFGIAAKIIIGSAFISFMMTNQNLFSMDDYKLAVVFSTFVLVLLGIFKISGMFEKLQRMSSSNKNSNQSQVLCIVIQTGHSKTIYFLNLPPQTSKKLILVMHIFQPSNLFPRIIYS